MGEERGEAWEAWREVGGEVWVGCTVRHGLNYGVRGRSGEVRGARRGGGRTRLGCHKVRRGARYEARCRVKHWARCRMRCGANCRK